MFTEVEEQKWEDCSREGGRGNAKTLAADRSISFYARVIMAQRMLKTRLYWE